MSPPIAFLLLLAVPVQGSGTPPPPPDAAQAAAKSDAEPPRWIDPRDGWFDLSQFLEHPAGFVPLVVPITEPALGYGAVLAAVFLDPREEAGSRGWARPNMTVVGGLATEDGSDGLFAANSTLWGDGDLQTLVGVGSFGLELGLYGVGTDPAFADDELDYRLEAEGVVAEVRQRVGRSDWWGGLRFAYSRVSADFEGVAGGGASADPADDDVTLAGPSLTLRYDSLDNMFTPTRGMLSDTSVSVFDDLFGGSRDFQLFQQVWIHHWPLAETFFLGVRGQFHASFGDVPFYARPYIDLRGIPALRYQGEDVLSGELELRWQFQPRIGLVGFGGAGVAWSGGEQFDRQQDAVSGGLGARYLISSRFGLHVGLDVAQGPEDTAIYVQFGNAWMRP